MENSSTTTIDSEKQQSQEINIESFIQKISTNFSIKKKIIIHGKLLHFQNESEINSNIINFSFKIFKNTDINPFTTDILIDIELVPNLPPHSRIRSDFTLPSLYDNRNIFLCLTNQHEYIYNPDNLQQLENILKDITNSGIENFLYCIYENIEIKTFIYYGEYKIHSIYNINDFLENSKLIKLYRVNQIFEMGKKTEEKYIIVTQLHILIFKPQEKDKTFAELIFMKQLKNIIFNYKQNFNKKLKINTFILYIQDIKTPNGKIYEMEFTLIDRSRPPAEKEEELDSEEDEEEPNTEKNQNQNNTNNNSQKITNSTATNNNPTNNKTNNTSTNCNNSNNNKINNTATNNNNSSNNQNNNNSNNNNEINKEEIDVWDKYYKFEEEIEKKQKEINFQKYKIILETYKPLFDHRSEDDKKTKGIDNKNVIMEYEKMFQHCEKLYNYYEKKNDNKRYKKRMDFYMVNINFMCAELMGFFDLEKANFQFYFDKMKCYLNKNEKNQ